MVERVGNPFYNKGIIMSETIRDEQIVVVRRQWNDHRQAAVRFNGLDGVHWTTLSGGVMAPAPQPFLHGYILCDAVIEGELAHSCMHGSGPHSIKVCIVKKDNDPKVFARLVEQAGPKPPRTRRK